MLLNNAYGRRTFVDTRWEDRRGFHKIKGPVHQIFNYKEHNLTKYDELKKKGMTLRFLDLKDKENVIRRYILEWLRKDDYEMVSREITRTQRFTAFLNAHCERLDESPVHTDGGNVPVDGMGQMPIGP